MGKKSRLKKERAWRRGQIRVRLQAIYDHVPEINCKGLCHETCGIIPMFNVEFQNIAENTFIPIDPKNIIVLDDRTFMSAPGGVCPLLQDRRCTAYDLRPLICRLYGSTPGLTCEHGCAPDELMSREEVIILTRELQELTDG
jgi:Fe-S-cluster containining protein